MAAACDVIYIAKVAMEINWTLRHFFYLKVQTKFTICAKYQVNRNISLESRGEGSD